MDWTTRMNQVMDYVETHLSTPIVEKEIAKIAACSYTAFQFSFSQITGISFSEYIRRRKLTCAAYDLQNTDTKIIDIAIEHNVPVIDNAPVARALFRMVDINQQIPPELYKAVAEILLFVYGLKSKNNMN